MLVAGLIPIGAGKTTLAASLASAMIREGFSVSTSKPVGATDLWGAAEVLSASKQRRLVVTRDGLALLRAIGERLPPEVVNPVGILLAPLPPSRFPSRSAFESSTFNPYMRAAVARVTACYGRAESVHLVDRDLVSKLPRPVEQEIEDMVAVLSPPPVPASREVFEGLFMGAAGSAADSCISLEEKSSDVVVIESNSDVAAPTPLSAAPDVAVVVSPGEAYVIEGSRYSAAISALALAGKPWAASVREVFELAGYISSIELPLLEDVEEGYSTDVLQPVIDVVKSKVRERPR